MNDWVRDEVVGDLEPAQVAEAVAEMIAAPSKEGARLAAAKLDGVLRSHQINPHPDARGSLRDTCVYSIVASEWPAVRAHLDFQLSRPREGIPC